MHFKSLTGKNIGAKHKHIIFSLAHTAFFKSLSQHPRVITCLLRQAGVSHHFKLLPYQVCKTITFIYLYISFLPWIFMY